jgi:cytochrome b561
MSVLSSKTGLRCSALFVKKNENPGVFMDTVSRYTRTAMLLHWLIALLILVNVGLGLAIDFLPEEYIRLDIDTHKSIGLTVLGLAVLRLIWRFRHQPPALPANFAVWEKVSAHIAHIILYVLMIALPLSGWLHDSAWKAAAEHPLMWFYTLEIPRFAFISALEPALKESRHDIFGTVHMLLAYVLYLVFFLHVGGALKHEIFDKESVLKRMLPWWPFKA